MFWRLSRMELAWTELMRTELVIELIAELKAELVAELKAWVKIR